MNTATIKKNVLFGLILGVLAVVCNPAAALNVDSLKTELSKAKNDTSKVNILNLICSQPGQTKAEERLKYINQSLALATQLNYQKGKASALHMLGICKNDAGNYDEGLKVLDDALKTCPVSEKKLQSSIYNTIAGSYYYKGDYTLALQNYLKSLALTPIDQKKDIAATEFNISLIHYQNQHFAESEKYVLRAKAIWEQLKDTVSLSNGLGQLGNIYYAAKEFPQALTCYTQAQAMAEKFTDKSYQMVNLLGMSNIYKEMEQYPKAIGYCKRALDVGIEVGDRRSTIPCYQNLGVIYSLNKNYTAAIDIFKKGITIAKETGSKYDEKEIYYNLSEVYALQNNYKDALKYQQL